MFCEPKKDDSSDIETPYKEFLIKKSSRVGMNSWWLELKMQRPLVSYLMKATFEEVRDA